MFDGFETARAFKPYFHLALREELQEALIAARPQQLPLGVSDTKTPEKLAEGEPRSAVRSGIAMSVILMRDVHSVGFRWKSGRR
jgi:hypothetical protein